MTLFWHWPGGGAPYRIGIARAEDHAAACALFGLPPHANTVHSLTSPKVIAEARGLNAGATMTLAVPRLPSAYDRFQRPGGGMDFDAMADAGFEVT